MNNNIQWPLKKWLIQYALILPTLFLVFSVVQYLKGRTIEYSIEFGIIWSVVTLLIFGITRAYYFKKQVACSVCNDIASDSTDS